jgi:hypothetical protein
MPEIPKIKDISKQTHLNRDPLENDITQASRPCKRQMKLPTLEIDYLAGFCVQVTARKRHCSDSPPYPPAHSHESQKIFSINLRHNGRRYRKVIGGEYYPPPFHCLLCRFLCVLKTPRHCIRAVTAMLDYPPRCRNRALR